MDKSEQMAELAHEVWVGWMQYMFSQGRNPHNEPDGCWVMPPDKVKRWTRQMNTPYSELTEAEKTSDREIAQRYLDILKIEN